MALSAALHVVEHNGGDMPVTTKKIGRKVRVVNARTGRVERTKKGKPVDGGGHGSIAKARRQTRAINARKR